MKSKPLTSIGIAVGGAFGTTIAQLVQHGPREIEPRKWIEKPRS